VPSVPIVEYRRTFEFPVSPADMWTAIEDSEVFEAWWPWLREFTIVGGSLRAGSVMKGVVVPPIPYRMRIEIDLVRCRRPHLIDAAVHGDLEGEAELRFRRSEIGTRAEVSWRLEMMQRPMRIANRVARPLLVRAHDAVVEVTVSSFRRHLVASRGQARR
jgi:carbon monoxide dehydrogenase subunit G